MDTVSHCMRTIRKSLRFNDRILHYLLLSAYLKGNELNILRTGRNSRQSLIYLRIRIILRY